MNLDDRITSEIGRLADPVAFLEAMFAAAPLPLQIYDATGRSVLTNRAFRDVYGDEPPPGYNVLRDEVAIKLGVVDLIRRAFAGELITTPPHWYDPRGLEHVKVITGRRVGQVVTMVPLRGRDGSVAHVAIFVKDVTAELAEQERSAAERGRLAVVTDISAALTTVLDDADAASKVVRLLVPRLADMCALLVLDDDDRLVRVTEAALDPTRETVLRAMRGSRELVMPEVLTSELLTGGLRVFPDYLGWVRELLPAHHPYRRAMEAIHPGQGMVAPLRGRDRVIGVLTLATDATTGRTFTPDDLALAGVLGERIGVALDNARLFTAARRARDRAELVAEQLAEENRINQTLVRLAGAFSRERDHQRLLTLITDEATAVIGARFGALFFNVDDEQGGTYMLHVLSGADAGKFANFRMPRATPIFAPTFRGDPPIRLGDVTRDPRFGAWGPQPPGHPPVVSYLAVPVTTRDGEVIGGLFFGHPEPDRFTELHERLITGIASQAAIAIESARLYDAMRASEERARTAVRRKDEFLAILGHELRNPLAPIVTAVEVMRTRPGGEAVERERTVIERQVIHLSRLVDDLLDLSRITSGKVVLDRKKLEIADVISEAVERVSPLFEQHQHQVRISTPRTGLVVDGDLDRLAQVMTNLLHNAAKFTPDGGTIAVEASRDDDAVVVEVRDDGRGIERDLLDAIFELFVQGAQDLQRAGGGLGIGLALVKHLTVMHGGTVFAESAGAGQGATFRIRLPALPITRPIEPVAVAAVPAVRPDAVGKRILVVDDNVDAAEILADLLSRRGHEVRVAFDAVQALAVAHELRPEVAILDIGLPVVDGYELAVQLRAALPPPLRLIALTGYGQEEDRTRAQSAGFDAHLVKPATVPVVLRALDG